MSTKVNTNTLKAQYFKHLIRRHSASVPTEAMHYIKHFSQTNKRFHDCFPPYMTGPGIETTVSPTCIKQAPKG